MLSWPCNFAQAKGIGNNNLSNQMAKRRLSSENVEELITHYQNERRRLTYQLDLVKEALADLKIRQQDPAETASTTTTVQPKRGPGRPRKTAEVKKTGRKPGRPKKRVRKERELNEWDSAVLDSISSTGRLMPKDELLEHLIAWAKVNKPGISEEEVQAFLTRTLQKLSGKKKLLGTHQSGLRRGYHYGLIDWFFKSSGRLRKNHYHRLVLEPTESEASPEPTEA